MRSGLFRSAQSSVQRLSIFSRCIAWSARSTNSSSVPGHPIENLRISNIVFEQSGGADAATAALMPEEREAAYPDPACSARYRQQVSSPVTSATCQ